MAQRTIQLDQEKLSCSICLQLLKLPVTIPCGHSYCMDCIKNYWDEKETHSCPQCREIFTPQPVLVKNTMLAELLEDLKKAEHLTASPDHLIKATSKLQENICPRHDEEMKIFCCTDQRCICYLCLMNEHKDHVTVSAAAERAEKQKGLGRNRQKFLQRIQEREKDVKIIHRKVEAINLSADKAFRECDKVFKDLISLIERKSSEVKQKIRSKQKSEQNRVKELQEKIEQEIRDLRRRDTELQQLSLTEDNLHFLNNYSSLSHLSASTNNVTASVSRTRDKVKALLSDEWPKISVGTAKADILLPQGEPKTRDEFLKYSCQITLDPNTRKTIGGQSYDPYEQALWRQWEGKTPF
uniref:RING-type domain-containing protein n=1 Tax=Neolamprologus brichardi TaxID=32507 RepID=A0A3Q4MHV2_NEOBR